jgi:hypothetical protein
MKLKLGDTISCKSQKNKVDIKGQLHEARNKFVKGSISLLFIGTDFVMVESGGCEYFVDTDTIKYSKVILVEKNVHKHIEQMINDYKAGRLQR